MLIATRKMRMSDIWRTSSGRLPTILCAAAILVAGSAAAAQQDKPVEVIVYPILIEAPLFGASIDLPSLLGDGLEGRDQSGSTDVSLNALYMAGVSVRANRWFAEARGQWADLSASRATPHVTLDTRARFFTARGGITLVKGLSVAGGVRRIWGELDASLAPPILGDKVLSGSVDKTLYDPLIGADWRGRSGKFIFEANFLAGGFGVGTDRDVSGEFDVNWRFTPHTDLRLGWGFFNYKISTDPIPIGSFQRTLVSSQTLNGPVIGFGIVF
jgi:hypothetical protein